ncbi:J domain-containing protein [Arthrobacter sp. UYEF21]|uniref:J domain-containing protein n=1 Tax=Arthrobacter sp. UYEF21 TaxID=1756364 RepID=UPI003397971A
MPSQPDPDAVLRVKPDASQQEISRAYRSLIRTRHPDVEGLKVADHHAEDGELLRIMQAYAVLRNPERRAAYDGNRAGATTPSAAPTVIPIRKVAGRGSQPTHAIGITPVRWESGPSA